jgi:hypothetical protein
MQASVRHTLVGIPDPVIPATGWKARSTDADLQERLDSTATELRAEMEKLSARVEVALHEGQEAVALE